MQYMHPAVLFTTSLLSNALNQHLLKAMKSCYSHLSDHNYIPPKKLISFDSDITVLQHCGNQSILKIRDITASLYPGSRFRNTQLNVNFVTRTKGVGISEEIT